MNRVFHNPALHLEIYGNVDTNRLYIGDLYEMQKPAKHL
jgi:hypothetical protein